MSDRYSLTIRIARSLATLTIVALCAPKFTSAVVVRDLFTVQGVDTNFQPSSCAQYLNDLDAYLQDAMTSVSVTIAAIGRYNEQSPDGTRIRNAFETWFGVKAKRNPRDNLRQDIRKVLAIFEEARDFFAQTVQTHAKQDTFLFCDSTWITEKQLSDTAQDTNGNDISVNGNPLPIDQITELTQEFSNGAVAWWAGDYSPVNTYFFASEEYGANYCQGQYHQGLTSPTAELIVNTAGTQPSVQLSSTIYMVILCPRALTNDQPDTFADADQAITALTTIEDVLPRFSTLLHETFHLLQQGEMLTDTEKYRMVDCVDMRKRKGGADARRNPETYVFFSATMVFLFGDPSQGITRNWDFSKTPQAPQPV